MTSPRVIQSATWLTASWFVLWGFKHELLSQFINQSIYSSNSTVSTVIPFRCEELANNRSTAERPAFVSKDGMWPPWHHCLHDMRLFSWQQIKQSWWGGHRNEVDWVGHIQLTWRGNRTIRRQTIKKFAVRELTSPRLDWPQVGLSANCPVSRGSGAERSTGQWVSPLKLKTFQLLDAIN